MRTVAKLLINIFFGKFLQRTNMSSTEFYNKTQLDKLNNVIVDATKNITDFNILSDDKIMIDYNPVRDFQTKIHLVNPAIGGFATSYGRLRLYKMLDMLQDSCIYSNTDSAFMIIPRNIQDSITIGHYLGDVESELSPQDYITQFVSIGYFVVF